MNRLSRRRTALWIGGGVAFTLLSLSAQVVLFWWLPNHRLSNIDWYLETSPDEQRRAAEWILRLPAGNHHDACLILKAHGDERSIPALRHAVRWAPAADCDDDDHEDETHCRTVLQEIESRPPRRHRR